MGLPGVEFEVSSEKQLNRVLKTDSNKLFKDFLTNKIFSKQRVYLEFRLNRELVWKLVGWKLII